MAEKKTCVPLAADGGISFGAAVYLEALGQAHGDALQGQTLGLVDADCPRQPQGQLLGGGPDLPMGWEWSRYWVYGGAAGHRGGSEGVDVAKGGWRYGRHWATWGTGGTRQTPV